MSILLSMLSLPLSFWWISSNGPGSSGSPTPPPGSNRILLEDNVSFLLLEDGVSKILLES